MMNLNSRMTMLARRTCALLLTSAIVVPGVSVLSATPASAETVCFKENTELDFINNPDMANSRAKLENAGYFGPGGAVAPETLDFASLASISEGGLIGAGCDIFIGGGFGGSLTTSEGAALASWTNGPRNVVTIGGCDFDTANNTCLGLGRTLTDTPNGGVRLNKNLAYNPLTCGGADAVNTFGGRSTFLGLGPSGTDIELALHNTFGSEPAVTTDSLSDPTILFTADADMFGSNGSGDIGPGQIASSNQAIFILNVFKFALDGINGRLGNPQCFESYNDAADLELAVTSPQTTVAYGQTTVSTIEVANVLGSTANDVSVSVTLPAGFDLVSASGPGTYDSGTGLWTVGTLAASETRRLAITLRATTGGTATMRAEIIGSSLPDGDSATNVSFGTDDRADGILDDDEDELSLTVPPFDLSDAPDSGIAPDGGAIITYGEAAHGIVTGMFLGAGLPDADTTPQRDASANADDTTGSDDEDGVTFPTLSPGSDATIRVAATGPGFLQAWIDWNGNGAFDAIEQVATDMVDADGDGIIDIPVTVPADAVTPATFARFRWSSDFGALSTGYAADGEVEDYRLTFATNGPMLSGRILLDNGAGGGTAHDALVTGTETGGVLASVTLTDGAGNVIATPAIGPDGRWSHVLGASFTGSLGVSTTPLPGYLSVSEATAGLPGLSNPDAEDGSFSFAPASGQSYTALDIGFIETPRLDDDNVATAAGGQTLSLAHRYRATTSGTVTFTYQNVTQSPAGTTFSAALFDDTGCDGLADAMVTNPRTVVEGQVVCIVSRISVSGGAAAGAALSYRLVATSAFAGLSKTDADDDIDRVTVGGGTDQLVLSKTVRNITTGGSEGTANLGDLGDILEYRITLFNPGAAPVADMTVSDRTPAYTRLSEPAPVLVSIAPGVDCALTTPAGNVAGYAGPLAWQCSGSFPGGGDGSVAFRVQIVP